MRIEFTNVGPLKVSWSIEADAVDEDFLEMQVRKRRVLRSRCIFVVLDEDDTGTVFAGIRPVGRVRVLSRTNV